MKPLQLIWDKLNASISSSPYGPWNTVHVDDLARNFALNRGCGVKCKGYYRKKKNAGRDAELRGLGIYLSRLKREVDDFEMVEHRKWERVVVGEEFVVGEYGKGTKRKKEGKESKGKGG